jgi:hypothetical protein
VNRFWGLLLALVLAASLVGALGSGGSSASQPSAAASAECGVERWPVKTLSDPDAGEVNFHPKTTTVGALRSKPAPAIGFSTPRISGVETTTYKVRAKLIEYALEDDRDIHLVISSPSNKAKTMIVEFPDPSCPGARDSRKKRAMRHARAALVAACGAPSTSFHDLHGKATITGVGFFDVKHGQNGVAPNAIELHPVLGFAKAVCSKQ